MILYTYSLASRNPENRWVLCGDGYELFTSLEEAQKAVRLMRNEVMIDGGEWAAVRIEAIEIPPIATSGNLLRLLNEGLAPFIRRYDTKEIVY